MLSRKYYIMIAKTIKDNTEQVKDTIVDVDGINTLMIDKDGLIYDLCAEFRRDNNSFDTQRFIEACKDD